MRSACTRLVHAAQQRRADAEPEPEPEDDDERAVRDLIGVAAIMPIASELFDGELRDGVRSAVRNYRSGRTSVRCKNLPFCDAVALPLAVGRIPVGRMQHAEPLIRRALAPGRAGVTRPITSSLLSALPFPR